MNHDELRIELAMRLRAENYFHGGMMPRETAIAWKGYLAACLWRLLITAADYWYLVGFLPFLEEGTVEDILTGRDELPDEARILELEPKTIPQCRSHLSSDREWKPDPVPITKPQYIDGILPKI